MAFLTGKKTYIVAIVIGCVVACQHLGYIDEETAKTLIGLLTDGGLATLRAGVETVKK
jgi:hypothetical protein